VHAEGAGALAAAGDQVVADVDAVEAEGDALAAEDLGEDEAEVGVAAGEVEGADRLGFAARAGGDEALPGGAAQLGEVVDLLVLAGVGGRDAASAFMMPIARRSSALVSGRSGRCLPPMTLVAAAASRVRTVGRPWRASTWTRRSSSMT
jgi:hypothetical protein